MKLIPAGEINYGVCFQFELNGDTCCANHRYINNGYHLNYFMNNKFKAANYKSSEHANTRFLILREDISGSAKQRNRLKIREVPDDVNFNLELINNN